MEAKIVQYIEYFAGSDYKLALRLIRELKSLLASLESKYEFLLNGNPNGL